MLALGSTFLLVDSASCMVFLAGSRNQNQALRPQCLLRRNQVDYINIKDMHMKYKGFEKESTALTSNGSVEQSCSPHGRERAHTLKPCGSLTARVGITAVLRYVKKAFDDAELLDGIPLDSAANAGAWKAWRAHRKGILNTSTECRGSLGPRNGRDLRKTIDKGISLQRPSQSEDWNWDGVWQERVRNVIIASNSELALYGASDGDDPVGVQHRFSRTFADITLKIRFVETDDELVQTVKTNALLS